MDWKLFGTLISALLGGGIGSMIFEVLREYNKNHNLLKLIKNEIATNIEIMRSVGEHQWITHQSFSFIYENYITELFRLTPAVAKSIMEFYTKLESLRGRDKENEHLNWLRKERSLEAAQSFADGLGHLKRDLRNELIALGEDIING